MAIILSIESACAVCSIALHDQGKLLGLNEVHKDNVHAKMLLLLIKDLLEHCEIVPANLDAIAVSKGPGSYTGLRIGVSVAKGLAFAHQLPLIGIDTLQGLAYQLKDVVNENGLVVPMIDARRMEIYTAMYDSNITSIKESYPLVVDDNPFLDHLDDKLVYFIGDGVPKLRSILEHFNARFPMISNSAKSIGYLAFERFKLNDFEDLAYFEPEYLKDFKVLTSKKNLLMQ